MNKNRDKLINEIFQKLENKQLNFASCESYTGGLFASEITNVKGSSKYFLGSLVLYSTKLKIKIIKIKKRIIKKYGVVSQECAEAMANNTKKLLNAHLVISFTGNADKNTMEDKPPFNGYISINYLGKASSFKLDYSKDENMTREKFKELSVDFGIKKIIEILE